MPFTKSGGVDGPIGLLSQNRQNFNITNILAGQQKWRGYIMPKHYATSTRLHSYPDAIIFINATYHNETCYHNEASTEGKHRSTHIGTRARDSCAAARLHGTLLDAGGRG
jgi:hypothetical protein